MDVSRCLLGGVLALSCACSSRQSTDGSSGASETTGSDGSGSESESNTGGSMDLGTPDIGTPVPECTTELDCGVAERCIEGICDCVGCGCSGSLVTPGTIEQPEGDGSVPVFFDIPGPECEDDSDCGPLEFCDGYACLPTTACVEDLDCYEDWPLEDRFCVDDECRSLGCEDDLDCPEVALCEPIGCEWIEVVPACPDSLSFDELIADTLVTPDAATVVVMDLDVDGRDDLAIRDDGALRWVMSTGVGFEPPTPWLGEPGTNFVALARGDIHGDGIDELLVSHANGVEILVVGAAGPAHAGFVETIDTPDVATTLDVDADGLPDLLTGPTLAGLTTLLETQIGDGAGTFGPLWTEDVEPFEWLGPIPFSIHHAPFCSQALASAEPDFLGSRWLDWEGVDPYINTVFERPIAGHMFIAETATQPGRIVASAPLVDRGVLLVREVGTSSHYIELSPEPGDVALVSPGGQTSHVIIERGVEPAEFVELSGSPFVPVCRGSLGVALDVVELQVGDFDGDGREDLLGRGDDGVLHVWYSRA
jgi:hypothetical protein